MKAKMKILPFSAILLAITHFQFGSSSNFDEDSKNSAVVEDKQPGYVPHGPLVKCSFLPLEFVDCEEPFDHKGNKTAKEETGKGCVKFGGSRYEDVERATVTCEVLPDIECFGPRIFKRDGVPCVKIPTQGFLPPSPEVKNSKRLLACLHKPVSGLATCYRIQQENGSGALLYKGHYFATTLIYSILLGFLGMDRFSLAQTGTAVGKLLTLGGVGIWWLVDIVLLVTGSLQPEDSSNWNPYV